MWVMRGAFALDVVTHTMARTLNFGVFDDGYVTQGHKAPIGPEAHAFTTRAELAALVTAIFARLKHPACPADAMPDERGYGNDRGYLHDVYDMTKKEAMEDLEQCGMCCWGVSLDEQLCGDDVEYTIVLSLDWRRFWVNSSVRAPPGGCHARLVKWRNDDADDPVTDDREEWSALGWRGWKADGYLRVWTRAVMLRVFLRRHISGFKARYYACPDGPGYRLALAGFTNGGLTLRVRSQ